MVAKQLRKYIGEELSIVPNDADIALIISCNPRTMDCFDIEKDVHFVSDIDQQHKFYSKGSAIAHVLAMKKGLGFLAKLNDNSSIMKSVFNGIYYILKKIKKYYNNYLG